MAQERKPVKPINKSMGLKLRIFRHELGLNQKDMAELMNIAQSSLNQIEYGIFGISPEAIMILVDKKNLNPNFLYGLTDKATFPNKVVKLKEPDVVFMNK